MDKMHIKDTEVCTYILSFEGSSNSKRQSFLNLYFNEEYAIII